jgi:hypothetical protein
MTPAEPRQFRTKTGTCTITEDRIVLAREGLRGVAAQGLVGSSVNRPLIIYSAVAAFLAFSGVRLILQQRAVEGALLCVASLLLARAVFRSRGLSATPEIPLASVQRVEAKRPRPPLTRGHFVVHFEEAGRPRKRLIILPGSLSGGTAEFNRAYGVLKECGLLREGVP